MHLSVSLLRGRSAGVCFNQESDSKENAVAQLGAATTTTTRTAVVAKTTKTVPMSTSSSSSSPLFSILVFVVVVVVVLVRLLLRRFCCLVFLRVPLMVISSASHHHEEGEERVWCVSCVCLVSQSSVCGVHKQKKKSFTHDDDSSSLSPFQVLAFPVLP